MALEKPTSDISPNTLFVRGIPPSCSNETLQEVFSKAGAVKECFVVKYKNSKSDSGRPCIGYVTYTMPDDAKAAMKMEKEFSIDKSTLKISFARKKKFSKKKDKTEKENLEKADESNRKEDKADSPENVIPNSVPASSSEFDDSFTVLVSGLPALYKKEHVLTLWKKCGLKEPQELIFPCENFEQEEFDAETKSDENTETKGKNLRQNAKFIVDTKQAALKAYNKLAGKVVGKKKNYTLKVNFLTPEGNFKAARKSRLIIRNVSFQCSEDDLKKAFGSYGTITEVKIPLKPDGKKRGFAFVQFSHVFEATKAIKAMNMKEIKGRKVAIDWSLPKEKFKELNTDGGEAQEKQDTECQEQDKPAPNSDEDSDEEMADLSSDSGMEEDKSESEKEISEDEEESDEEESEEEDEQESESDEEDEDNPYSKPMKKASSKPIKKLDPKSSHDVREGRTVFIFNLSYDTTEEQLDEVFQEYGDLSYTKIVLNRETGMSKGCGFAQFKTAEEAKKCIAALGGENSNKVIDGRHIRVTLALTRGDNEKMRKEGKKKIKEKEDKRNLYLGREGLVRPGTQAAEGLSAIELKKREKIENAKRAKLKNPNVFVSTTRLCVHNLPKSVNEAKLRDLLLGQFKNRRGVRITECRIMRDRNNVNEKGIGQPLGYAFVNFAQHDNALKALRSFNNNPEIFGPIKRPIVEFALENKKALEIKEQRKKKFLAKQKLRNNIRNDGNDEQNPQEKPKKIGRRKRQLMKHRLERGEDPESGGKRRKIEERTGENFSPRTGPKSKKFASKLKPKKLNQSEPKTGLEERKPFQGSRGTTMSGKKLPLPTHSRPKIRAKNKGKILEQMRKSKKLNSKSEQRKVMEKFQRERGRKVGNYQKKNPRRERESRPQVRKLDRDSKQDKEFNALVAKYTKTFMEKSTARKTGDKWYQ